MSDGGAASARRGAFYGRRKGHKLRHGRAALFDSPLPRLALDLTRPAPADPGALFTPPVPRVALEIGFGSGENFIRSALAEPQTGHIGCEPFVNGMASAL